jgi:eukaryotic-like serine/threonine-protein kinase
MGDPALGVIRTIGRYSVFDEIASGGMATVYLGRLIGSGGFVRTVAIKSLHAHLAKDPEFVAMFLDEARLAARIRHPNVVPTLDVVASKGEVFLVMEYVQGETLSRLARLQRSHGQLVPLPIVLRIMSDVLHGLHAAHEAHDDSGLHLDIVHRDVSPQNVLVGVDGVARVLDFGVAKATGRSQTTRDGAIKGKLSYMAPEQLMSKGVTRQTDVYAASVVLWELLTGRRLFTGDSEADVIGKLMHREIPPPSQLVPQLPPALDAVVMRGLADSLDKRFATARDMCAELARCGIAEAPTLAVGEWVQSLATDTLADRSAKIAAIASLPASVLARSRHSTFPPPTAAQPSSTRPDETRSDVLSVSLNTHRLQRNARLRAWGPVVAAIVLLPPVAFALSRAFSRDAPQPALHAAPPSPEPSGEPPPVARAPVPSSAPEPVSATALPGPSATESVPSSNPATPPPASRAPARSARPVRHAAPRTPDAIFDSRE